MISYVVLFQSHLSRNCKTNIRFTVGFVSYADNGDADETIRQRHGYKVGANVLSVQLKADHRYQETEHRPSE